MKIIERREHTTKIRGEREEDGEVVLKGVKDLPAKVHEEDGRPCITSHWQPDEEDLQILNEGGCIELDVLGSQLSPVRVSAVPAEEPEEDEGVRRPYATPPAEVEGD